MSCQKKGFSKWILAFLLTDETYSILTTLPTDTSMTKQLCLAFFNYCWWILGSLIGALIGVNFKIELAYNNKLELFYAITPQFVKDGCEKPKIGQISYISLLLTKF
uniref:AzlC family ABC transporter permease n=1 Tax=Turicimonas muris TaxID=1796652 RepID=UPI00402AD847